MSTSFRFLDGGGESGALIGACDWSRSSIGQPEVWSQSLRTTLANLLHSAFPMFLFWGPDLVCFYNDAFRPSLGNEGKHPAIGKCGRDVWPEIWDFIGPLIEGVRSSGKPVWFEDQLVPFFRNGRIEDIYWTFSYSPAFDDDGAFEGVLVTCMETTAAVNDRNRVEELVARRTEELALANASLQQSHDYLQDIINRFQEPLQVLEPVVEAGEIVDFRFKLTNAAYAAYANVNPADLVGKKVGDVFPGYFQTSSFNKVVDVYRTGLPETWEIHYDQDGLDLYNMMSAAKLGEEVILHFTDFTDLKHLQLELMRKVDELNRSNAQLEEFAHAASHDLKEPIRKIEVFTQLLKRDMQRRLHEHELFTFSRIESATERMRNLVDDLLAYSHVSQTPSGKEPVELSEVLGQVLEDLELEIQERDAGIHIDSLPTVPGFRRQIQQSFQNLISNALKYQRPGVPPRITIRADEAVETGKSYYRIEVSDNGIGFEPQYADKIFQIFARLHGREEYGGTGVGLSIVKKVVENHNGLIRVDSVPGQGSVFRLYLPCN